MSKASRRKKKKKAKTTKKRVRQLDRERFFDREISMLEFNSRVLSQSMDKSLPLLERVRFAGIFHSNLDEFFMKRIHLSRRMKIYDVQKDEQGQQVIQTVSHLSILRKRILSLYKKCDDVVEKDLVPDLKSEGVHLLQWDELTNSEKSACRKFYEENIFPILTPLAVDPGHPFPHISNLSTSLAVSLRYPRRDELFFARIKVPQIFSEWHSLGSKGEVSRWVHIRDIIANHLDSLFPNMKIVNVLPFRIVRNIDFERDEDKAHDLLEMIEEELKERRFGEVVKLQHAPNPDPWLLNFLMEKLELNENDVYETKTLLDSPSFSQIASLDLPKLKFKPWTPAIPRPIAEEPLNLFHCISRSDVLMHHPFESFTASVENLIRLASEDPNVLAIKMTLYRTNEDSSLIRSLIRAAEAGKEVVCAIELKARFDEERNISWANVLEEAGAHIVYGMVGLKTHCKAALIVRKEEKGIKSYAHFGTGNYHSHTAKLYTDIGLLTANPALTQELVELFHHLTGRSQKREYKHLLVAPTNMKSTFIDLIRNEAQLARKGQPAEIIAKCNALEDNEVCSELYKASQDGVKINLIVRGICILRPGVPGLSDNVKVTSVVDRFLEHSRIYYFKNGQKGGSGSSVHISSADWMHRNLNNRVETAVPILEEHHKQRIYDILQVYLNAPTNTWQLDSDGKYTLLKKSGLSAQGSLLQEILNPEEMQ